MELNDEGPPNNLLDEDLFSGQSPKMKDERTDLSAAHPPSVGVFLDYAAILSLGDFLVGFAQSVGASTLTS